MLVNKYKYVPSFRRPKKKMVEISRSNRFEKKRLRQLSLEELDGVRHHAATRIHDVLSPGLDPTKRKTETGHFING